jgi:glycosyltransferase involved in cell wall biosynthesis
MRIAQVAPLFESVPPKLYGGTERIVSYLTEELVAQGHQVTLFASGDSVTRATLEAMCPTACRLDKACRDAFAYHILMLERVAQKASEFDVVHFHIDYLHFPLTRRMQTPSVSTLHGRLDLPELKPLYNEFRDSPVISISDAQRKPLPQAKWVSTIYHGVPRNLYELRENHQGYLAFIGRVSPEKGVDDAINIARQAGIPLKIAAKVDTGDRRFYESRIKPLLEGGGVEFIGEISEKEKNAFLGGALGLLFPINWPEPFGLAMIESMACGTPVISYPRGSVPEVIDEGVTGFIVKDLSEAVEATRKLASFNRTQCRKRFEERFTASRMANDYLKTYHTLEATLHG